MKSDSSLTKISVVIPLYCCEKYIEELNGRLVSEMNNLKVDFEIIYVNDSSPLNDWQIVKNISTNNSKIKGINLSKNFGQHYAIKAGLSNTTGDWIVVMDGDLQDRPEEISKLYHHAINNDLQIVWGRRKLRHDNVIKKLSSKMFYSVFDYLSGIKSDPTIANFSIINKIVLDNYLKLSENNQAYPMFIRWLGFKSGKMDILHDKRHDSKSSYSIKKLFTLAFDIIIAYSNKPLKIGLVAGIIISIISFAAAIYFSLRYYFLDIPIIGWTSLIVSIWFIFGVILSFMGLLGLYIGKTFNETKNRPLYVIKETINLST